MCRFNDCGVLDGDKRLPHWEFPVTITVGGEEGSRPGGNRSRSR